jgi:hypothetical protein
MHKQKTTLLLFLITTKDSFNFSGFFKIEHDTIP